MLRDRLVERGVQHRADVADRFDAETFGLVLRLLPLDPTVRQQGVEEFLEVERRDLAQREVSDAGLDVKADVAFVGFVGRGPHVRLLEGFEPGFAPVPDRHLVRDDHVDLLRFRELGGQLFLDLRLRLAEDILEYLLSCYGIMTDGVASFPPSVGTFADTAFAVRTFLCHICHPFRIFFTTHNTTTVPGSPAVREIYHSGHILAAVLSDLVSSKSFSKIFAFPIAFSLDFVYTIVEQKLVRFSAKSCEAYWMGSPVEVASIQAVRPTVSGADKSGESYRKWKPSKAVAPSQPFSLKGIP